MRSEESFLRRSDVLAYCVLTFFISWSGAFAVAARSLLSGQSISKTTGLIIFPVMLLGPFLAGILLTWIQSGSLRNLFASMCRWRTGVRWYGLLLLPPALILVVLFCLRGAVSPSFLPNNFYFGLVFGIPAGLLEEIGWTGYVYPRMAKKWNPILAAAILGMLWSLWHLPAINFLGASAPHGAYWFRFFLAFTLAMTAMRVLICWLYRGTKSVLMAQLMHISSTGSLVIFSPHVTPPQEAMWYAIYGVLLWVVVAVVIYRWSVNWAKNSGPNGTASHNLQISSSRS